MGTRHLIGVVIDDEWKIAQYGQWDGYPGGQGRTVHQFLTNPDLDIVHFIANLRRLHWATPEEVGAANRTEDWSEVYPWLSRNAGAAVLQMVYQGRVDFLVDQHTFGWDSLFCEWAYVINLDGENPTLEVYRGFNSTPAVAGRWAGPRPEGISEGSEGYHGIELIKLYEISGLPDLATFCEELEPAEVEA